MAKILVAEDEQHIAAMITFKLENAGHRIVRARDGEEALFIAGVERPDLVLLDVMMPVINGFEVLRRLRADPTFRAPIIMVTAKGQERDVLTGLRTGAADYIVKPFSPKELLARIELALSRGMAAGAESEHPGRPGEHR